jgi:hypothetical protein
LLAKIVHCGIHLPHLGQCIANWALESGCDGMKQQQKVSDSLSARVRGNQAQADYNDDQPSPAAA